MLRTNDCQACCNHTLSADVLCLCGNRCWRTRYQRSSRKRSPASSTAKVTQRTVAAHVKAALAGARVSERTHPDQMTRGSSHIWNLQTLDGTRLRCSGHLARDTFTVSSCCFHRFPQACGGVCQGIRRARDATAVRATGKFFKLF